MVVMCVTRVVPYLYSDHAQPMSMQYRLSQRDVQWRYVIFRQREHSEQSLQTQAGTSRRRGLGQVTDQNWYQSHCWHWCHWLQLCWYQLHCWHWCPHTNQIKGGPKKMSRFKFWYAIFSWTHCPRRLSFSGLGVLISTQSPEKDSLLGPTVHEKIAYQNLKRDIFFGPPFRMN